MELHEQLYGSGGCREVTGLNVPLRYSAQRLASTCIVEIHLVILLQRGKAGASIDDIKGLGRGGCHDGGRVGNSSPNPSLVRNS